VWGESGSSAIGSAGVAGFSNATEGAGVYGHGGGIGVKGECSLDFCTAGVFQSTGSQGYGIYARGDFKAASLDGDVEVIGDLSATSKHFKIDDPIDPAHEYLVHTSVESPDMKTLYDGIVKTNGRGFATVRLPRYFQALNRSFRYQLTSLSGLQQLAVAKEIAHNRFTIQSQKPHARVAWQVTGIRRDPWANAHREPVEQRKPAGAQGKYLFPQLYGRPATARISREARR
jgi:hypothetical protein